MELEGTIAAELTENGDWVLLTPTDSASMICKGLDNEMGSLENRQILENPEKMEKNKEDFGCNFGEICSSSVEIAQKCDGFVSNSEDDAKSSEDLASKGGFMGGISDNSSSHQETIEVEVHVECKNGSQLDNGNSHFELGSDSIKASSMLKNQIPKKRSNKGIALSKKSRKRLRIKRHRPKVFDEGKPKKPSTPKLQPPKRAKYVKKDRLKTPVDPLKDVDREAVSDHNINSCEQKLDSNIRICTVNEISKDCDGIKNKPEEEPKVDAGSRFTSLQVYQRKLRPNECLKNSRKLGPNCPSIFKRTRSGRQRATVFDKFVTLVSMSSPFRKQRRAAVVARKLALMVSKDLDSSFESSELHGKPEGITDGVSDNRPHQETDEVEASFSWEKGSHLHNHDSDSEFENNPTKASSTRKNQNSKKRRNNGTDLNKKPRKKLRMKRNRWKIKSKPIKPSTPKPRTPQRARYAKKDSLKTQVDPLKDFDCEAVGAFNRNSCRHKLDFNMDNSMSNHDSKVCDELKDKPEEEPKLESGDRFSSLQVYRRILRPNECLKNSRKLGPNCPRVFKKTRSRRQRVTLFAKFIMVPPTQEQQSAEMNEPMNLCAMVKDRKPEPRTSSRRQQSLSASVSTEKINREAIERPTFEKCSWNVTWMVSLKRKRSKASTRRRDLSFFVNDLLKRRVSDALLLNGQDTGGDKFAYGVEHLQDNAVFCNGSIHNCPKQIWDCIPGVEKDLPKYSFRNDMLNVRGQSVVSSDVWEMRSFSDKLLPHDKYQCKYDINDFLACFQQEEDTMLEWTEHPLESDIVTPCLVGPVHERTNPLSSRDYDQFTAALVDFATQRMECLHIDDRCNQLVVLDQDAHGALVPSTGKFDPSKKRKILPKVDLDDETMRVWNLLMENNGSEHTEPEDDDKAKYWEEQREIFSGRADSFIARMHLFQGDRRFSPWKGSVVDSVVGVFLTQNVSDHLSSSAFMTLASTYPPPSMRENSGCEGQTDHVIDEIQKIKIAETSSDECKELSIMENHIRVDPENGNKTSSPTESMSESKKDNVNEKQENTINWDALRKKYSHGTSRKRPEYAMDSVNWEAVRKAPFQELSKVIASRGMNNILAGRIKDFLDRIVRDHGSIDLEWLRDVPPDKVKEYLLSIPGLGLKSVECVRLLTLHHHAFPVDTNVGRLLVRLGWVPLQPLPEDVQIHLLEQYPLLDTIQKYIWPRVRHLPQLTLYELHYQMITFGKVFCTKRSPNCNACPMRAECRHYASAFASQRCRLEGPPGKNVATVSPVTSEQDLMVHRNPPMLSQRNDDFTEGEYNYRNCEPIVEIPASPEPYVEEQDIEDFDFDDDEIPTIKLNSEEFTNNVPNVVDGCDGVSKALVALRPEIASIPMPKLKAVNRLRTVHHVYELPDSHPLLAGFDKREPDDPCPYLLRIWMPDETTNSSQESRKTCNCKESTTCDMGTCCSREIVQHQNDQIVQGTILIPCRTANRGSFPLNGTYFQVNEVFADQESGLSPITVPRQWIWNLRRRSLHCGTSATSISRGMSLEEIEYCFRQGFICIRGIDRRTKAARPLMSSFHEYKTKQVEDD